MGEMDLVASCGLQVLEQCSVCKTHNNAQLLQNAALKELRKTSRQQLTSGRLRFNGLSVFTGVRLLKVKNGHLKGQKYFTQVG